MIDTATPPSTRARAADSMLDHSAKAIQLEDIGLRRLEARLVPPEDPRYRDRQSPPA
jgi:hypothetical protein